MGEKRVIYEKEKGVNIQDPDETSIYDRKLITQPYDLVIEVLMEQINNRTLHLRPISERPTFQRRYVWPPQLASRLIESILLNVPIPPCYLSQNEEFELDVIDGQQRIFSIYRFIKNHFRLSNLEVLKDLNRKKFHQLSRKEQRKIETHTLRCVVVTNDSNPEIKFDVFQRLNTNTVPLNEQEIRNCIFRGPLNDLLGELAEYKPWLNILGTTQPDKRMRDEELILRFFAFHIKGVDSYRTPQKHWLNDLAREGRKYSEERIEFLRNLWRKTIDKCLLIFKPNECFRKLPLDKSKVVNRALMDLTMHSLSEIPEEKIKKISLQFYEKYKEIIQDKDFSDLISRAVDHKKRTRDRFKLWEENVIQGIM